MKKIFLGLIFMFLIFSVEKVGAIGCNNDEIEKFQKYANNVAYVIEPVIGENNNATFDVIFTGIHPKFRLTYDIYGVDIQDYYATNTGALGEIVLHQLKPGNSYVFKIHGVSRCYTYTFKTFMIDLPNYNQYFNSQICDDAREYKLCQKWVKVDMDYQTFEQKVIDYKNNKNKKTDVIVPQKSSSNIFYEIYEKYYWPILGGMIALLGLLIYLWIKEQKKNQL